MALAPVAHELGALAEPVECGEEFLALLYFYVVHIALHDEQRRLDARDVRDRTVAFVLVRIDPRWNAEGDLILD